MNDNKIRALVVLNTFIAVGMATSVFTGQLKISLDTPIGLLVFPASNIFFALLTFPVTDIVADVFGTAEARRTVWVGFASQFMTIAIVQICLLFPGDATRLAPFAAGGWMVLLGSAVAYFAAQMWDVWIFHWIRENVTGDRHLWVRNNLSTISSQLINSTLFIGIVFGPKALMVMIPGSIVVKLVLAVVDTPLVYAGRAWARRQAGGNGRGEEQG